MKHEEIFNKYISVLQDGYGAHVKCLQRDDALKAMAEATEFWVKQWNFAQEQLSAKERELSFYKNTASVPDSEDYKAGFFAGHEAIRDDVERIEGEYKKLSEQIAPKDAYIAKIEKVIKKFDADFIIAEKESIETIAAKDKEIAELREEINNLHKKFEES